MSRIQSELDDEDLEILKHVEENGMEDIKELANQLDVSKSTIYFRVNRLKERNIIQGVTADINPSKLGLDMHILTRVYVVHEPGYPEEIGTAIADIAGVQQVFYTMGDVDFMVLSRSLDREGMNHIVEQIVRIDGVEKTSSTFLMEEINTKGQLIDSL